LRLLSQILRKIEREKLIGIIRDEDNKSERKREVWKMIGKVRQREKDTKKLRGTIRER
jgi:hypothetical protein